MQWPMVTRGAAPNRIAEHGFVKSLVRVGIGIAVDGGFVNRIGYLVADRLDGAQIGDDGIEIFRQERLVEIGRHDGRERHTGQAVVIGPDAFDQRALDLRVGPVPDSGFNVRGDVRRGDDKRRRREYPSAR